MRAQRYDFEITIKYPGEFPLRWKDFTTAGPASRAARQKSREHPDHPVILSRNGVPWIEFRRGRRYRNLLIEAGKNTFTVELTAAEIDVIIHMWSIADAGDQEGDYAMWTPEDWAALRSLIDKLPATSAINKNIEL